MRPELTKELRLQFIATYPRQTCVIIEKSVADQSPIETQDQVEGVDYILTQAICERVNWSPDQIVLLLRPMSAITDEEAEFINKHFLKMTSTLERVELFAILMTVFRIHVPIGNDLLLKQFYVKELIELYQHLVSLGIAMDWRGYSVDELVAAGWIKMLEVKP